MCLHNREKQSYKLSSEVLCFFTSNIDRTSSSGTSCIDWYIHFGLYPFSTIIARTPNKQKCSHIDFAIAHFAFKINLRCLPLYNPLIDGGKVAILP